MTNPVIIDAPAMAGAGKLLRVIDTLAEAFTDLAAGRLRSPSRTIVEHGPDRQLLVGPAIWERHAVGSVKITTLTPQNPDRGLPLIHGVVVLTDLEDGRITAQLDGAELTAVRTGAVAGLATRLCAPPDAAELALVGAGAQARALLRAMCAVRPIRSVRVHSRTRRSAEAFAEWARENVDRSVRTTVSDTLADAVKDAPLICTATSTHDSTPLVDADLVAPGAHVNVIGGTNEHAVEIDPALLGEAYVVVEERSAALDDAGEVRRAVADKLLTADALHELGALTASAVSGNSKARAGGRTSVFRSVGLAIEDTAAAFALYEAVREGR